VLEQPVLAESLTTLAETFRDAGYTTVGIPSNIHLARRRGFGQGFDHYYDEGRFMAADRVVAMTRAKLQEAFGDGFETGWREGKTFLWIHFFDPHDPYLAKQPWIDRYAPDFAERQGYYPVGQVMTRLRRMFPTPSAELAAQIRALYRSEVSFADDQLRQLSDQIGLAGPDVLLVVTADHGEQIAEHGGLGHGVSLYEEELRIPLLIHWPAGLAGAKRSTVPVSLVDLFPTLLDAVGIPIPAGQHGRSLLPLLRGEEPSERELFFELHPPYPELVGVRHGPWKLIRSTGDSQLFELTRDPQEQADLAERSGDLARRLGARIDEWRRSLAPAPPSRSEAIEDPELKQQLKALGYIQ
jgi:arylsulfatase A-like enzyme